MLEKYSRAGLAADAPFKIFAVSFTKSFGDFVNVLLFVTNIAAQFEHSRVTFVYEDDADFKAPLLQTTEFAEKIALPGSSAQALLASLDGFDFIATDSMVMPPLLCSFSPLRHLRFTTEDASDLAKALAERGVVSDRWFCTLYSREPGYKYKPKAINFRDTDPAPYLMLRDFIIDELGGQVVRLGHPEMTEFPARDGFVDLSRLPNNPLLQAFAMSRARFGISTPSGPFALGHAFGTPMARVNCVDYWQVSELDIMRTVDVVMASGEVLRQNELYERGLDKQAMFAGGRDGTIQCVVHNDLDTLQRITVAMHRETEGVAGWRSPVATQGPAPNVLSWPRRPVKRVRWLPL